MLRSKKNHKTRHRKYKKTLKMNGGASFFDPFTKYLNNTSKVNEQVEKMNQDKNNMMDSLAALTKTYNNVLSNVTDLESRINGLSDINQQCIGLYPTLAPSTSSTNNGFLSYFNPAPAENQPAETPAPAENQPAENQPAENQPAENQPAENQAEENQEHGENQAAENQEPGENTKTPQTINFPREFESPKNPNSLPVDTNELLRSKETQTKLDEDFKKLQNQGNRILEGEDEILQTQEEILSRLSPTESPPFKEDEYEEPTQLQDMNDLQSKEIEELKKKYNGIGGKRKSRKHKRRSKRLSKRY